MKKSIIVFVWIICFVVSIFFNNVFATTVDTIKPELISVNIDKKEVEVGEEIEITVEAIDEGGSGINRVSVYFSSPITYKTRGTSLTKDEDGKYRGKLQLGSEDESGEWMIYYVVIYDNLDNYRDVYNSNNPNVLQSWNKKDLGHCNFTLTGTTVDTIKPELISVNVDKKEVEVGEEIEITVEAIDEGGSGINRVSVYFSSPITYKTRGTSLIKDEDGKYRGRLQLSSEDESGEWMIYYVVIYDNLDNYRDVYNSNNPNVLQSWNKKDLGHCNFTLLKYIDEDLNKDGKIDILDLAILSYSYGKTVENFEWNPNIDFNKDKIIDLFDMVHISKVIN